MNKTWFMGRIASDPELRTTESGAAKCSFRIASQRKYKNAKGEKQTDFFTCIAWRQNAQFIHKFFHKGDMISLWGELQNRSYQAQDGMNRLTTEVVIDEIKGWGNGAKLQGDEPEYRDAPEGSGFAEVDDADLPF